MKAFFVFSGQGAQSVGMGRDLCDTSSAAKAIFDRADRALGYKLSDIIWNGPMEKLTDSRFCQTAIYTTSCAALAAFQEKFTISPVACAGLSLGEYAAFYAGKAFDFETGLKLLQRRGELMDAACKANPGGMASVLGAEREVVEKVCREVDLDVANYNSPAQIVISGPKEKIDAACAKLREAGVRKIVVLNVAGSFHSRLMHSAGEELKSALAAAKITTPEVAVLHNYTALPAGTPDEIRANLAAQVSGSVKWEMCLRYAVENLGADTVIEFGPGNVLTGLARRTIEGLTLVNINSSASLDELSFQ